jgi:hypothetical protein
MKFQFLKIFPGLSRKEARIERQKRFADEQKDFERLLRAGDFGGARYKLEALVASYSDYDVRPVLEERFAAEERARMAGVAESARVKLFWADAPYPGNAGDSFNPWLIEELTGAPALRAEPGGDVLLAAGSIAHRGRPGARVWGSGFIARESAVPAGMTWHAARGPISRDMVLASGQECAAVFGDPALLAPLVYKPKRIGGGGTGLVLHYSHLKLARPGDAALISPVRCGADGAKAFIDEICRCDYIFSTSLHGLIFANAYGIPARWCHFHAKKLSGDGMKFADYFQGVGAPVQEPASLSGIRAFDSKYFEPLKTAQAAVRFDADAFLNAFPWPDRLGAFAARAAS